MLHCFYELECQDVIFVFVLNNDFGARNLRGACVYVEGAGQDRARQVVEGSDGNVPGGLRKGDKVYAGMRAEKWEAGERVGKRSAESNQRVTF